VTFPPLTHPKLVLDSATPKRCNAELTIGTAARRSPCPRPHITAAIAINTTGRGAIRTWVLSHHRRNYTVLKSLNVGLKSTLLPEGCGVSAYQSVWQAFENHVTAICRPQATRPQQRTPRSCVSSGGLQFYYTRVVLPVILTPIHSYVISIVNCFIVCLCTTTFHVTAFCQLPNKRI